MYGYLFISALCGWLFLRELRRPMPFDAARGLFEYGLLLVLGGTAFLCAWMVVDHFRFERLLTTHAREVSGNPAADVHCQAVLETMMDTMPMAVAHARPDTGQIEFKATWCGHLADYLDKPEDATGDTLWALHVFTHEVMHIRGERNEKLTDCQAYQRNFAMAERLGVPADVAARHAAEIYANRSRHRRYFSSDCRRGGRLDEQLPFPPWPRS